MEHVFKILNEKLANNESLIKYLQERNAELTKQNKELDKTIIRLEIRLADLEAANTVEAENKA